MRRSTVLVPAVVALTVAGGLGLSAAAAPPGAPSGRDIAFPSAVEPAEPAIPTEAAPGAPDRAAMDAPVRAGRAAAAAPAQAVDDGPLTGFEQRGGADWTTIEEASAFLRQVDRLSDRVSMRSIGRTLEGRRIDLVQIGATERTQAQVAAGSTALVVCSQHGNEPAGREACLQGVRDLAFDTSAATGRLLERSTILFVPTANPDGRVADTRGNSEGVDINRDHLALETNEGRAIARVVRDYKPQLALDAHEFGGRPDVYDRDLIRLWPRHLNVDRDVRGLSVDLSEDYIDPTLQGEGFTTGDYGIWYGPDGSPIAQIAGNEDERIMRNTMGLKHRVAQLAESLVNDFDDDETETENKLRRVLTQTLTLQATLDLVLEQGQQILAETRAAAAEATAEGAAGDQPYFFAGADNMLPPSSAVDLTPPCAYRLTAEQFETARGTLALHGITSSRDGDGRVVTMAQPGQPLIPLLLDARANYDIVQATPVECAG